MWESNKKENAITSIQSAGHEGCAAEQDKKSEGRLLRASANEQETTAEAHNRIKILQYYYNTTTILLRLSVEELTRET